jgi:hypothetical protein
MKMFGEDDRDLPFYTREYARLAVTIECYYSMRSIAFVSINLS